MDTFVLYYFVVPVSLGAIILLIGGTLLFIDSRKHKQAADDETEGWATTGGKILSARIAEHESRTTDARGLHIDVTYEPVVEYVYSVDGAEYQGNKVFPGESEDLGKEAAQEFLNKYPINSYAPVRYNPKQPSVSSLEEHSFHRTYRTRMIGQVLVAFGICVCCFTSFMLFLTIGKY